MVNDTATFPTIVTSRRSVPNEHPIVEPTAYRIAVVGEAPGEDEENHRRPFVGKSGQFLTNLLRDVGIDRHQCLLGNVCQYRPPANRIEAFSWDGIEIQEGLAKLREDIRVYNPHICVLLGNTPLRAARGICKITDWRGSLFSSTIVDGAFFGRKCVASLHPAFVLREFSGFPLLKFDLKRAADEGRTPSLDLPKRELITNLGATELCYLMDNWLKGQRCSVDMEGGLPAWCVNEAVKKDSKKRRYVGWRCVALSGRPTKSFAIAWWKFNEGEHVRVLQSYSRLMFRRDVPKVLQNSLYDNFTQTYGYSIPIINVTEDVMLKGWESYCELPKRLTTQASIWTREPHWKDEEMYESTGENLAVGCCKDSAVTLEICNAQDNVLTGLSLQHYRKNVEMLNPLLYMELRGIKYDQENVTKELETTKKSVAEVGDELCRVAGKELRGAKGSLSSKRLAQCLYVDKGYPPQFKKEFGRKTDKLTTDVEALLALRKKLPTDDFLNGILRHRHLEGIIETLSIKPDPDGRVRCGYNIVGTETGRLTCYTSPTGAGANLQTITKKLRKNYVADDGYDFFQCDLSGADGWTVAAHCKKLGDPTMLEDYYFGLKPAKIIVLIKDLGSEVNLLDRDSLKNACRVVDPDGWEYFAGKRIQHSGNYLAGIPTTMTIVMKDSYKLSGTPIYLDHGTTGLLQGYYFTRYKGVKTWHAWAESKLVADGKLTSASGQTRIFFGRRFGTNIHDTVKEFLAHEPQSNTTWATNLAMLNLWNDPENRRPDGSLIIEPLHQVHDALVGQWPVALREWAKKKVKSYFNNTLTIAGTELVIPFEGRFGRSWGQLDNEI
jgi:uracil-DNA glycosylase family 4